LLKLGTFRYIIDHAVQPVTNGATGCLKWQCIANCYLFYYYSHYYYYYYYYYLFNDF